MNNPELGFDEEDLGIPRELLRAMTPQQVMLDEIVIECPVVIEFVGAGLSPGVRNEVTVAMMSQLHRTISHI